MNQEQLTRGGGEAISANGDQAILTLTIVINTVIHKKKERVILDTE